MSDVDAIWQLPDDALNPASWQAAFPMPFAIDWSRRVESDATDEFNEPITTYDDWITGLPIYGWDVTTASAASAGHDDRELIGIVLYVPPRFPPAADGDRVRLNDTVFEVVGGINPLTGSPFGWNPGGVVNARRVVG